MPKGLYDKIEQSWRILSEKVTEEIKRKTLNLLEKIEPNKELLSAVQGIKELVPSIEKYNDAINAINKEIQKKKDSVEGGDLQKEKTVFTTLQNKQKRHELEVTELCNNYIDIKGQKKAAENQKEKTKIKLHKITEKVMSKYEREINKYLKMFGADFRIVEKKTQYIGGTPSVDYKIKISGRTISIGDSDTPHSEPCFRNTLSDGDKSTLAFAFFMAKLDLDASISSKIIVLDDPINSLDIHRRKATAQVIIRKANIANQVFLLTHAPVFAKDLYDLFGSAATKCLCVKKLPTGSDINEWDIIHETESEYYKSYCVLEKYLLDGSGDLLSVARCIRPVLEGNLRLCFPTIFKKREWLGDFIADIKNADSSDSISSLKKYLDELEAINDYSKDFHHPSYDASTINSTELNTYVDRTIKFLSR